jgi:hypothetical protein
MVKLNHLIASLFAGGRVLNFITRGYTQDPYGWSKNSKKKSRGYNFCGH